MTTLVGLVPGVRGAGALRLGVTSAVARDDHLVVATVVPAPWPPAPGRDDAAYTALLDGAARASLDDARQQVGPSVDAEYVVHRARSVSSGLLELVREHRATSVVLGSAGGAVPNRVALGSVAERLLHGVDVPVYLAPEVDTGSPHEPVVRVSVALGRSDLHSDLLARAASEARVLGADLRVVCFAVRPPSVLAGGVVAEAEREMVRRWADGLRSQVEAAASAGAAGTRTAVEVVVGQGASWADALLDVGWAGRELMVVGASDAGLSRLLLGSHASKIVRHSPVPVVLVPRSVTASSPL